MWPHRRGRPPCLPEQEGWCHERPKAWQEHRQGWSAEHSDARNPCLLCQQQFKPRRGDRILSGLRHLNTCDSSSRGSVLRTPPPACVLARPSAFRPYHPTPLLPGGGDYAGCSDPVSGQTRGSAPTVGSFPFVSSGEKRFLEKIILIILISFR